jgi:hypothetical protein
MSEAAQEMRARSAPSEGVDSLVRRHLRFGWIALVVFVVLGTVLETMHGFKIGWYLDVTNSTRRFLWRLSHVHGTFIALINVAFAATARLAVLEPRRRRWASPCLIASNVLMPAGLLLGGIDTYGGDPGLGVLLMPVGAALLLVGLVLTALAVRG